MNITYDFYWRDGHSKMNETYPNFNWWCDDQPGNTPPGSSSKGPTGDTLIHQGCVQMQRWPPNCNDNGPRICNPGICLNDMRCNGIKPYICERE
jgi:hypothetical protein